MATGDQTWPASALFASAWLMVFSVQAATDSDTQEVNSYRLTQAGLARYHRATDALAAVTVENPAACDEDADAESLDGMANSIDAIPGASAAVQSAGMNSREYALFTMSLIQSALGAWVVEQGAEPPPDVVMENVNFYKEHEMELQELIQQAEYIGCGPPGDEDEDVPDWGEDEEWDPDEDWGTDEGWSEDDG